MHVGQAAVSLIVGQDAVAVIDDVQGQYVTGGDRYGQCGWGCGGETRLDEEDFSRMSMALLQARPPRLIDG